MSAEGIGWVMRFRVIFCLLVFLLLEANMENILRDLDRIDWQRLKDPYLRCELSDIPDLVRGLLAENSGIRAKSMEDLIEHICNRYEYVTEAAAFVVPFLIRMLDQDDVKDKDQILSLLEAIATASWLDENAPQAQWISSVRNAIQQGLDTYIRQLKSDDASIRSEARNLISCLPD